MTKPVRGFVNEGTLDFAQPFDHASIVVNRSNMLTASLPVLVVPIDDASVEAMVETVARILVKEHADVCNVNVDDAWYIYGDEFKDTARRYVRALGLDGGGV